MILRVPPAIPTFGLSILKGRGNDASTPVPGVQVLRSPTLHDIQAHDHVFHEIVYVETGTADHLTAAEPRKLRPGDIIVIQPRVWHAYRNPRRFCIINCLIDNSLIQKFGSLLDQVDGSFDLFRRRVRRPDQQPPVVLHARPADRSIFVEHLNRMMLERRERRNGWPVAVTANLLEILVLTARLSRQQHIDEPVHLADRTAQAVLDTVSHLEAHYDQSVSLSALAQRVHLSPGHLSRAFSRRMGMGPVEFVAHLRIEEACRLLRWSDESLKTIAARVGYNEISYFSRRFRAQIGQSPRQYRRSRGQTFV
jgi:AraC-like DNA-binding protein